jgi:hypothetical protein
MGSITGGGVGSLVKLRECPSFEGEVPEAEGISPLHDELVVAHVVSAYSSEVFVADEIIKTQDYFLP